MIKSLSVAISPEVLKAHQEAIMTFAESDPNENPWVQGEPAIVKDLKVVPFDTKWAEIFLLYKEKIQIALGNSALAIVHVGSTAVPGLIAKPIIDIDLIVEDPGKEENYIPALAVLGFDLVIRELSWYQHRMLKHHDPEINLHVLPKNCPEHFRHLLFRDWLIDHPEDCENYVTAKVKALNGAITAEGYNQQKSAVVKAIYQKIFTKLKEI